MKNLAQQIKNYRAANGLSMQRLSELCGIPKDRLYKWEKGHVPYMTSETQKLIDLINTGTIPKFTQPPQTSTIDKILPPIENTENCQNILNALKTEVDGLKQLLDERERVITAQEKTIDVLMRTIDAVSTTNATQALVKSKKHA